LLALLETQTLAVVLFIDQDKFCRQYADHEWVKAEAQVIEVDQEIIDHFQIGKVPQWRFFVKGSECFDACLVGTAAREEFQEHKNKIFGNLRSIA